jgi:hypothetical protein
MNTFDEETKKFFKHSGVRCVLAPRYGASKTTWFRQRVCGKIESSHYNCIRFCVELTILSGFFFTLCSCFFHCMTGVCWSFR